MSDKIILFFTNDERDLIGIKYPLIRSIIDKEKFKSIIFLSPRKGEVSQDDYNNKFPGQNIIIENVNINLYSLNPFRDIGAILKVWRLIRKYDPSYVFSMAIKPIVSMGLVMLLDNKPRISLALFSGLGRAFVERPGRNKIVKYYVENILRFTLKKYKTTAFQNEENINYFMDARIINKHQAYLCNGTGVNVSEYRRNSNIPASIKNIIMISRIIKLKGIYEFCESANILNKSYPELNFTLAGPKEPTSEGLNDDELSRILGVVKHIGYINDVKSVLEQQDLYVLPTNYPEGVPRSLLEAQSMNIPAITTDTPGCNAVIKHKFNGLLMCNSSACEIVKNIELCLEDPKLFKNMAINSRKRIEQKFEITSVNNAIVKRFIG